MITIEARDIRVGETKRLVLTPTDESGAAATLQSLSVRRIRPDGSDMPALSLSDFQASGGQYTGNISFDAAGVWTLRVDATDALGNREIEEIRVLVLP